MGGMQQPPQQPPPQGAQATGGQTWQQGGNNQNKRGVRAAKGRLWSDQFGGGFLDRQNIPPELMQQLMGQAMGTAPSAAEQLMRAGLGQQQAQAYGLAAGAQGMSPALAMRQAQQAAGQAGLNAQAQFGAMRAEEMARAQQLLPNVMFQQQSLNDAAAMAREQMLNQLVMGNYQTNAQQEMQKEQNYWSLGTSLLGGGMSGLGAGVGGALIPK